MDVKLVVERPKKRSRAVKPEVSSESGESSPKNVEVTGDVSPTKVEATTQQNPVVVEPIKTYYCSSPALLVFAKSKERALQVLEESKALDGEEIALDSLKELGNYCGIIGNFYFHLEDQKINVYQKIYKLSDKSMFIIAEHNRQLLDFYTLYTRQCLKTDVPAPMKARLETMTGRFIQEQDKEGFDML